MSTAVFDYYQLNNIFNSETVPGAVHLQNNFTAGFYRRYLFEKVISVYKWTLPKWWNKDYFLYVLYSMGYIGVINTDKYGIIPQFGTISGYNVFYAPSNFLVSNPLLPTKSYKIGEETEPVRRGRCAGIVDHLVAGVGGDTICCLCQS